MQDLLYLAITATFFTVCVGYVRALDRLVGPPDGGTDGLAEGDGAEVDGAEGAELAEVRS